MNAGPRNGGAPLVSGGMKCALVLSKVYCALFSSLSFWGRSKLLPNRQGYAEVKYNFTEDYAPERTGRGGWVAERRRSTGRSRSRGGDSVYGFPLL